MKPFQVLRSIWTISPIVLEVPGYSLLYSVRLPREWPYCPLWKDWENHHHMAFCGAVESFSRGLGLSPSQWLSGLNTGLGLETGQKIVSFYWTPVSNSSPVDFFGWYKLDSTLTNYWAICPRNIVIYQPPPQLSVRHPLLPLQFSQLSWSWWSPGFWSLKHCPWPLLFGRSYHYHSY